MADIAHRSKDEHQSQPEKRLESMVKQNIPGWLYTLSLNKLQQALVNDINTRLWLAKGADSMPDNQQCCECQS